LTRLAGAWLSSGFLEERMFPWESRRRNASALRIGRVPFWAQAGRGEKIRIAARTSARR
jgi:hypothetical protein